MVTTCHTAGVNVIAGERTLILEERDTQKLPFSRYDHEPYGGNGLWHWCGRLLIYTL